MVANIIGAGIFTTTGFQAADLGHPGWIYLLWALGGVLALAGALCYAELGAAMPEAGAEYVYLRETYGPALGFMSAFVSLIAGFSAPIAAATKSLVRYARPFVPVLGDEGAPARPAPDRGPGGDACWSGCWSPCTCAAARAASASTTR